MMVRLWVYLRGYVLVQLDGGLFSRFFNLAMQQKIQLFQIAVHGTRAHFQVPIKQYRKLRPIARKSQCRMRVTEKHGFLYDWGKLRNKAPVMYGLAVFASVLILLGNMVLTIRIKGETSMTKQQIIKALSDSGLKAGMFQASVNTDSIISNLIVSNEDMSWVTVYFTYGMATVEIMETSEPPENKRQPIAIVAKKRAQIKEWRLFGGEVVAKTGQTVQRGDVLVLTDNEPGVLYNSSFEESKVFGLTVETTEFELGKNHVNRVETGRTQKYYKLQINEAVVPLSFWKPEYDYYDSISHVRQMQLFGIDLPVHLHVTEIREISQTIEFLTIERAEMIFAKEISNYEKNLDADTVILERIIKTEDKGAAYVCTVQYFCYENIGEFLYDMP